MAVLRQDPRACVFVVDDEPDVLLALARVLGSAGFTVETFLTAAAFLERDIPNVPCCLVLDLKLPYVDGLELQEVMHRASIQIPIIFISGQADVASTVAAMRDGAMDFLEKPVDDSVLIDSVSRALQQDETWRLRRHEHTSARERLARLTSREREVCDLVAEGLPNKQIADALGISEQTVKIHRSRMMHKLEVESVAGLVRLLARLED